MTIAPCHRLITVSPLLSCPLLPCRAFYKLLFCSALGEFTAPATSPHPIAIPHIGDHPLSDQSAPAHQGLQNQPPLFPKPTRSTPYDTHARANIHIYHWIIQVAGKKIVRPWEKCHQGHATGEQCSFTNFPSTSAGQ